MFSEFRKFNELKKISNKKASPAQPNSNEELDSESKFIPNLEQQNESSEVDSLEEYAKIEAECNKELNQQANMQMPDKESEFHIENEQIEKEKESHVEEITKQDGKQEEIEEQKQNEMEEPTQKEDPVQIEQLENKEKQINYFKDGSENIDEQEINEEENKNKKQQTPEKKEEIEIETEKNKIEATAVQIPSTDSEMELLKKIGQLDTELLKFKEENAKLQKIKNDYEQRVKSFTEQITELEDQKVKEVKLVEERKEAEIKKLIHEKKEFERQLKLAAQSNPTEQNQEIERLNKEISYLKNENKQKEANFKSNLDLLKKANEELIENNEKLHGSIKLLETQRIKQWDEKPQIEAKKQAAPKQKANKEANQIVFTRLNPSDYDLVIPEKYTAKSDMTYEIPCERGKLQRCYQNGKKEIIYSNGMRKEVHLDGYTAIYYNNGDIKQTFPGNFRSFYYFSSAKAVQVTYSNGTRVLKFSSGQVEKHFPDGVKQIL